MSLLLWRPLFDESINHKKFKTSNSQRYVERAQQMAQNEASAKCRLQVGYGWVVCGWVGVDLVRWVVV